MSAAALERGVAWWTWEPAYLTGDGWSIQLGGTAGQTSLLDNEVWSPAHLKDRIAATSDIAELSELLDEQDRALSEVRANAPMICKPCRERHTFRIEKVQVTVSTLWRSGLREFPLYEFAAQMNAGGGATPPSC